VKGLLGYRGRMRPRRLGGAACVIFAGVSLLAAPAVAAPRLDARFGDGGVARVQFEFRQFRELSGAMRPVRQADGKVLVGAQLFGERSVEGFVLTRFGRRGRLDRTFGRRGRVRITLPSQFQPLTLLARRDGRIVLVGTLGGYAYLGYTPSQIGIIRLLPDGSRDPSFGASGVVVWNPPSRGAGETMDVIPGLALPRSEGRLLVAAMVDERTPYASRQRVVLVRFRDDGSVDRAFGKGGFAELDWDGRHFDAWARLADGRLAGVLKRPDRINWLAAEPQAWWLHTFEQNPSPAGGLVSAGSRLGFDDLDEVSDLVPTRDGGLVMVGVVDSSERFGPVPAVRRILPGGSLDPAFGRDCGDPLRRLFRSFSRGGARTPDGGVLTTVTRLLVHARPRRVDGFAIAHDATGCIAGAPLRLRGLTIGPPRLQPGRRALVGATFTDPDGLAGGLALIKIRR
jgi:uncharacterized delta-60 repeat protein